jgi:hypothetical protein
MRRQFGDYEIRRIEPSDHVAIRDAVLANEKILATDFPNVAPNYQDIDEARERVAKLAELSADPHSGLKVFVAADGIKPRSREIYGLGTRQELGKRATGVLRFHGLLGQHGRPHLEGDLSLVAGWTTGEHPNGLAKDGLEQLLAARPFGRASVVPRHTNITFIRPDNIPARNVASEAGMEFVQVVDTIDDALDLALPMAHDYVIGAGALRLAGIVDGVKFPRIPYFHRNYEQS